MLKLFLMTAMYTISSTLSYATTPKKCNEQNELHIKWSGGEHAELGNTGFRQACEELGLTNDQCPVNSIYREDQEVDLSYGKVVALGDFYASPMKAYKDKRIIDGLERVFKCIDKSGKVHGEQEHHPEVKYPDCTWVNIFSGTDYLKLLTDNHSHFGWYNVVEYVKLHKMALNYAIIANRYRNDRKLNKASYYLNLALFTNAFADHYLTDAFSAGHVRVPRKQLKNWAKKNIKSPFKSFIGDALGNILHDFDGKNRNGEEVGLLVTNSLGDSWITHSDEKLHHCTSADDPGIKYVRNAVSLSVQEVLIAYSENTLPKDVYTALNLVPFASEQSLQSKFALTGDRKKDKKWLKSLRQHLALPLRVITTEKMIKKALNSLSSIMNTMSYEIKNSLLKNKDLQRHLPKNYKEQVSQVQ